LLLPVPPPVAPLSPPDVPAEPVPPAALLPEVPPVAPLVEPDVPDVPIPLEVLPEVLPDVALPEVALPEVLPGALPVVPLVVSPPPPLPYCESAAWRHAARSENGFCSHAAIACP